MRPAGNTDAAPASTATAPPISTSSTGGSGSGASLSSASSAASDPVRQPAYVATTYGAATAPGPPTASRPWPSRPVAASARARSSPNPPAAGIHPGVRRDSGRTLSQERRGRRERQRLLPVRERRSPAAGRRAVRADRPHPGVSHVPQGRRSAAALAGSSRTAARPPATARRRFPTDGAGGDSRCRARVASGAGSGIGESSGCRSQWWQQRQGILGSNGEVGHLQLRGAVGDTCAAADHRHQRYRQRTRQRHRGATGPRQSRRRTAPSFPRGIHWGDTYDGDHLGRRNPGPVRGVGGP